MGGNESGGEESSTQLVLGEWISWSNQDLLRCRKRGSVFADDGLVI